MTQQTTDVWPIYHSETKCGMATAGLSARVIENKRMSVAGNWFGDTATSLAMVCESGYNASPAKFSPQLQCHVVASALERAKWRCLSEYTHRTVSGATRKYYELPIVSLVGGLSDVVDLDLQGWSFVYLVYIPNKTRIVSILPAGTRLY